jgi:hypothetical protein
MKQLTFRLKTGQLLKEEIEKRAKDAGIKGGVLLSLVGGLKNAVLRMAGSTPENPIINKWDKDFEIVSGTGTISDEGCHIHVSLSDKEGNVVGGHLKDGCAVRYTAEVVIGIFDNIVYKRVHDDDTGFEELAIE